MGKIKSIRLMLIPSEPVQAKINKRRIGKTTRVIDKAIQDLYKYGELVVPKNDALADRNFIFDDDRAIAVDPDWRCSPYVQKELFHSVLKRLKSEHPNQYTVSGFNSVCPTIKLIK